MAQDSSLEASAFVGLLALHWANNPNESYWSRLGFEEGGNAVLAFVQFISKTVAENNYEHVAFVARDGFTL